MRFGAGRRDRYAISPSQSYDRKLLTSRAARPTSSTFTPYEKGPQSISSELPHATNIPSKVVRPAIEDVELPSGTTIGAIVPR